MGKNYKKAKHSELIESIDTETEKELLKRDIGSNFQLNLFQETTILWSLCNHSQFCWALGMPWMLHMGIPLSQWGKSILWASLHTAQHRDGHQGLSKCPGGTGQHSPPPVTVSKHSLESLGSSPGQDTSCRNLGASLPKISVVGLPKEQPTDRVKNKVYSPDRFKKA